jgi:uroporphyrinogen-III decarboxylase
MSYMVEGEGSRHGYTKAKTFLLRVRPLARTHTGGAGALTRALPWQQFPEAAKRLLDKITDVCVSLLIAQYFAGAQYLQVRRRARACVFAFVCVLVCVCVCVCVCL